MKVKDLIAELQKLPEDAEIGMYVPEDTWGHFNYQEDLEICKEVNGLGETSGGYVIE